MMDLMMEDDKPKVLIPITIQFSVRYLLRTQIINRISSFAQPVILLGWHDDDLERELIGLGCIVYETPKVVMSKSYSQLRNKIHQLHFQRINSCSTMIDFHRSIVNSRLNGGIKLLGKKLISEVLGRIPGIYERYCETERRMLITNTNYSVFEKMIMEINPKYFLSITPFFLEEEFLARVVANNGIKSIAAILSFDNLTTRPRIPVIFDKYLLWNEFNRQELFRIYPTIDKNSVQIVGSPQFDFYYDPTYLWDERTWRERLSIPDEKPVILFGAGPESITPLEPHIAAQLDRAIDQGLITGNPVILLRLHPVDTPARWEPLLKSAKNIIFDLPWKLGGEITGRTNITRYDIEKLVSTLKYCNVHINTSSTMSIDGAIFDRPQIGPAYDDRPGRKFDRAMRELYLREHYLPLTTSGGLRIAYSIDQLIDEINDGFENPKRYSNERKSMVRALCTFDDGKSTDRVVRSLQEFIIA